MLGLDPRVGLTVGPQDPRRPEGSLSPAPELTQPLPAEPLPPPYHLQEVEVPFIGEPGL